MLGNGSSRRLFAACTCCASPALAAPAHAVSRRRFVAGGVAALGLGASIAAPARLLAQAQPAAPRRIDVHHHVSPVPWVDALKKARLDTPPINNWTVQKSLDEMDQGGVATAIVSTHTAGVGFLAPKEAAAVARASNEWTRKLADDHKGRFGIFALVPMPYPDESLKEIEYALDTLKADGIALLTSYGDKYLGDASFTPVMEELNRRKAAVYTHPSDPACCGNIAGFSPIYIEYSTDTTRTIASLIFTKTSARFPDINLILSHGGGTVTAVFDRFTAQIMMNPKYREFTHDGVTAELKRFYYDTAQASNPVAMASLTKMVPVSQIVFGSDYPYRTAADHVRGLAPLFSAEDLKKIDRDNAARLLPRWRAT
jgi:predicted TIM-barrel fold metal-dependent hydrolase